MIFETLAIFFLVFVTSVDAAVINESFRMEFGNDDLNTEQMWIGQIDNENRKCIITCKIVEIPGTELVKIRLQRMNYDSNSATSLSSTDYPNDTYNADNQNVQVGDTYVFEFSWRNTEFANYQEWIYLVLWTPSEVDLPGLAKVDVTLECNGTSIWVYGKGFIPTGSSNGDSSSEAAMISASFVIPVLAAIPICLLLKKKR